MVFLMFVALAIALVFATDQSPGKDVNRFLSEHVQKSVATLKL